MVSYWLILTCGCIWFIDERLGESKNIIVKYPDRVPVSSLLCLSYCSVFLLFCAVILIDLSCDCFSGFLSASTIFILEIFALYPFSFLIWVRSGVFVFFDE